MRQLIAANRHPEAMKLLWRVCRDHGYDPLNPTAVNISLPETPEEVNAVAVPTELALSEGEDADIRDVIMAMLSYAGATIFVSEVEYRLVAFKLGASLAIASGLRHHTAPYLISTFGITHHSIDMQEALCGLSMKLCALRPTSWLTGAALVVVAALCVVSVDVLHLNVLAQLTRQHWTPLEQVADVMTPAFDLTLNLGNYELTAYVFALDCAARRFSNRRHDVTFVMDRFKALRTYTTPGVKVLIHAPLQYALKLIEPTDENDPEPWRFEGKLLSIADIEAVRALSMHVGLSNTFALRLMVMYNAPLEEQVALVNEGWEVGKSLANTVFGSEWAFLCAIVLARSGGKRFAEAKGYLAYTAPKCEYLLE